MRRGQSGHLPGTIRYQWGRKFNTIEALLCRAEAGQSGAAFTDHRMQRGENIPLHTFCECSAIARRTRGRPPQSAHQSLGALATCPILPTWGHLGRFFFRTSLKQPPTSCTRGTTHTPTLAHHTVAGGLLCLCVLIVVPTSKLPPPESWDPPGLCRLTVASLRLPFSARPVVALSRNPFGVDAAPARK